LGVTSVDATKQHLDSILEPKQVGVTEPKQDGADKVAKPAGLKTINEAKEGAPETEPKCTALEKKDAVLAVELVADSNTKNNNEEQLGGSEDEAEVAPTVSRKQNIIKNKLLKLHLHLRRNNNKKKQTAEVEVAPTASKKNNYEEQLCAEGEVALTASTKSNNKELTVDAEVAPTVS
jgi:hypothetical protein